MCNLLCATLVSGDGASQISCFENDGLQKKEKKRLTHAVWTENASIYAKDDIAALPMITSIVLASLLLQVLPPLEYTFSFIL